MTPAEQREVARLVVLVVAGALGVAATRGPLVAEHARVKETTDVYVLPPPDDLVPMTLGYRAAVADVLWASVLVSQGLHMGQKRHFDTVSNYLDAINALDPTFRDPYVMTDALVTFQIGAPSHDEVLKTREILERGAKNLPLDGDIWLNLGGFVGYVAPATYLTDEAERAAWRADGTRYLQRAAELAGKNASISIQTLGAASMLTRSGEREAAITFYKRACGVTDDPDVKRDCEARLAQLLGAERAEAYAAEQRAFESTWRRDIPYATLTRELVLGPPRDTAYCAGGAHDAERRCAATWLAWRRAAQTPGK